MSETINLNHRDVMAAAGHAIALRLGASVSNPHPLAADLSLRNIAFAAGALAREPQRFENDLQIVARGIGTSDFSRALAEGSRYLVTRTYSAQAQHAKFCADLDVVDFRPVDLPGLDVDTRLSPLGEGAEVTQCFARVAAGANQVRLTVYGKALRVSRETIVNDQHETVAHIIASLGAAAARTEAMKVADALEGNQLLDDGGPVFHADYGNIQAEAFSSTSLGSAMSKLRVQAGLGGERADLVAAHLVVAPDLEYLARREVFAAGLPIEVSAMAYLPNGRWFLLAEKTVQPTIATLRLKGVKVPVRVEERRRRAEEDGAGLQVTADIGATLLGRLGIIRGGV